VFESYKEDLKVVNTDLELSDNFGGKFRFVMPPGITTIAAHTGHGKSKVMQHFALNEAIKNDEGCVVYIPYEESKKQVIANMLNVYANIELTKKTARHGNMQTILEYLHDGSTKFMKADTIVPFQRKLAEFQELLHKRRIKVLKPETPYISELKTILNSIMAQREIKIKCVFIDYIQELYIENTKVQRADELKEVMVELDMFSQRNNIPVVVAAQLKRETADTPLMLTNQCIADSSWIERKSSEIIIIWSNKEKCKNDPKGQLTKKANEEIPGLDLGTGGKIFFIQTKSRINPVGTTALLEINGNTGRIEGNYVASDPQQEIDFQVSATADTRTFDFD
jgi:replicative DNA helicase